MTREELLDEAKRIVMGARQENYGSPESNFTTIATLWSAYLTAALETTVFIEPQDVAAMMVLMKVARLANKSDHMDSWVDIAGYAANGAEIVSNE